LKQEPKEIELVRLNNMMRTFKGLIVGFRKDQQALKKFYNERLAMKYRSELRIGFLIVICSVVIQEVLTWLQEKRNRGVNQYRILFFGWIFLSGVSLYMAQNLSKSFVLTSLGVRFLLQASEMLIMQLVARHSWQK